MSEVVAEAVRTFGPWLAATTRLSSPREVIGDTWRMDY
jgi:hypothetical protein